VLDLQARGIRVIEAAPSEVITEVLMLLKVSCNEKSRFNGSKKTKDGSCMKRLMEIITVLTLIITTVTACNGNESSYVIADETYRTTTAIIATELPTTTEPIAPTIVEAIPTETNPFVENYHLPTITPPANDSTYL